MAMPRGWRSLPVAVALVLVVSPGLSVRAGEGEDPALIAARKRQEAAKTLAVELKVTQVIPRGALSRVLVPPFNEPLPGRETTFESANRLVLDGDKIRIEDNHLHTFQADRKVVHTSVVWLYDGSADTTFSPKVAGQTGSPSGIINGRHQDYGSPLLVPIAYTFRGLSPRLFPLGMTELKPTGAIASIDGVQCEEYTFQTQTYYLDSTRDFVVRRIQDKGLRLSRQYDIHYRQDEAHGWVPAGWEYKDYSRDGQLRGTIKVDVTTMRINEPLPPGEFEIKFPEGTWIQDQRDYKNYRVQADGSLREYDIVTGKELSVAVVPPPARWYENKWLLVGGAFVLAAGFVGAYFLRRGRVKTA